MGQTCAVLVTRNQIITLANTLAQLGARIADTASIPWLQWILRRAYGGWNRRRGLTFSARFLFYSF